MAASPPGSASKTSSGRRSDPVQQPPPDPSELAAAPRLPAGLPATMYREHADRPTSPDRGCWWFASIRPDEEPGGRFDRVEPNGTCYLGETPGVAVRERCGRFLANRIPIPVGHVHGRVVSTVRPSEWGAVADLTSPSVAGLGVTGELAAGNDYPLAAAWAEVFGLAGFDGLWYVPRFTPGQEHAAALFAMAGPAPQRPIVQTVPLAEAIKELGYVIAAVPSAGVLQVDDNAEPDQPIR